MLPMLKTPDINRLAIQTDGGGAFTSCNALGLGPADLLNRPSVQESEVSFCPLFKTCDSCINVQL